MLKRLAITLALVGAFFVFFAGNCDGSSELDSQRREANSNRASTFARAQAAVPTPRTTNFPLRSALAKMTLRQDLKNHPWYVYILGMNGNMIGYYVAQTVPINACDFLSSTEYTDTDSNGKVVLTAPSLDGIYYGGGGATAGCDAWFFFDAATDALIQIRGVNFYTADQPLKVDADPIEVK